jgi:hypothetical protein
MGHLKPWCYSTKIENWQKEKNQKANQKITKRNIYKDEP